MASPMFAMLAGLAAPAAKTAQRTIAAAAARAAAPIARALTLADVRYTRTGKVARGSRSLYNKLMNSKYGKPIGRHGMTWSQLADKGYGGGTPGYTGGDEADDDE